MLNFFAILLIIFIGILLLIFKKRNFQNKINRINYYSNKLKKVNNKNIKNPSKIEIFSHKYEEEKQYSISYKNSQRNKMFSLFQGNTEDKLKALIIAEEVADKSTLPILRKGLRDVSPEVVEISAFLIRKFK